MRSGEGNGDDVVPMQAAGEIPSEQAIADFAD
jgi:hypothetical protein